MLENDFNLRVNKELVLSPVRIRTRTRLQNVVKGNLKKKSGPVYSSIFIISKSEKDANLSRKELGSKPWLVLTVWAITYSLNSDWKRWPDFCFSSFCTYLSLFSIKVGWGGGEGATSWWVPHFFVRAELKLVSVVLVCTLIRYQIILALSKRKVSIIGFHSLSDKNDADWCRSFEIFSSWHSFLS